MVRKKSEGPREPKLLRVGVAAHELGLHPFTVRRWIKLGKIQAVRIGLEARIPRSESERLKGSTDERLLVLYGRVSGQGQRTDLEIQLAGLEQWAKTEHPGVPTVVLSDIGSGLKPTRKQLTRLLKMVCQDRVGKIAFYEEMQVIPVQQTAQLPYAGDDGPTLGQSSDGMLLARLQGHHGMVANVVWSPDGTRLASGGGSSGRGEVFLWDARSGERLHTFVDALDRVLALDWSPRGELLVSGGSDGLLCWWDVQSGEGVRMHQAHQGAIQALRISSDGRRIASCGEDGAVKVWDLESGELLRALRRDRPYERLTITGVQGLTEAQKATLRALGALEEIVPSL